MPRMGKEEALLNIGDSGEGSVSAARGDDGQLKRSNIPSKARSVREGCKKGGHSGRLLRNHRHPRAKPMSMKKNHPLFSFGIRWNVFHGEAKARNSD